MPTDEISSTNSVVVKVLQNQDPTSAQQSTTSLYKLLNTAPTTIAPTQTLSSIQPASALQVNETLNNLNFVPSPPVDALLINEPNPNLVTLLETQQLTPVQQAALAVNETIQTLTTTSQLQAIPIATMTTENSAQNLTPVPQDTTLINNSPAAGVRTDTGAQGLNLTAPAVTPTQITPTTTETTVAEPAFNTPQPILDRNPIAVPVYEIRDPKTLPPDPKPRTKQVLPPLPIGRVRPVDRLVLKREWEKRKESRQQEETVPRQSLEERSIREMISQANEDLAANGLPLRLVLAKDDEGYRLDIYDCSYDEECRLSHEVHLDLSKLVTILDNIQHETGIIVNIMT